MFGLSKQDGLTCFSPALLEGSISVQSVVDDVDAVNDGVL